MNEIDIWIDSALTNGKFEVKRTIPIEPDKTISDLLENLECNEIIEAARKNNPNHEFVLSKTPHGTELDGACVLQNLSEKILFFSDISRTGKCMVSVEN